MVGVKKSGRRARACQAEGLSNISTFSGGTRIARASLLAAGSASPQSIPTSRTGPVLSNGGAITVTTGIVTGSAGVTGSDGVDVTSCPATTIDNSGTITGGADSNACGAATGGGGVSNAQSIGTLNNSGTISGGRASVPPTFLIRNFFVVYGASGKRRAQRQRFH